MLGALESRKRKTGQGKGWFRVQLAGLRRTIWKFLHFFFFLWPIQSERWGYRARAAWYWIYLCCRWRHYPLPILWKSYCPWDGWTWSLKIWSYLALALVRLTCSKTTQYLTLNLLLLLNLAFRNNCVIKASWTALIKISIWSDNLLLSKYDSGRLIWLVLRRVIAWGQNWRIWAYKRRIVAQSTVCGVSWVTIPAVYHVPNYARL